MQQENCAVSRDDLANLLRAKIAAQATYSAAAKACRDAADGGSVTLEQRVVLDLREREALKASCAADRAYNDALDRFVGFTVGAAA